MALARLAATEGGGDAGKSLRERLVAVLRAAILEATLPPGTRLVETKLVERLGVRCAAIAHLGGRGQAGRRVARRSS